MKFNSLEETNIPQLFCSEYLATKSIEVSEDQVIDAFHAITIATADFMRAVKKKNSKSALIFCDDMNNFILAAVVEYNKNLEDDSQDNWNYYYTFYESDIKDAANKFTINESKFHTVLSNRLYEQNLKITDITFISPMVKMYADMISSFLEQNAKPGEEVELEDAGYFLASVTVENDEPVKAMLPDGAMKSLIKDDAATQKAA